MNLDRRSFIKGATVAGAVGIATAPTTLMAKGMIKGDVCLVVDSVDELTTDLGKSADTTIVKDINRGGIFIYNDDKSDINDGGIVFNGWVRQYDGALNICWFGAKGDGVADDIEAIQKAINLIRDQIFKGEPLKTCTVYFPSGTYRITDSIRLKQTVSLEGVSRRSGASSGSEILCDFKDFSSTTDIYNDINNASGHFHVTLDKKPIIYNTQLLTQDRISNLRLNGNHKDVYGLFINEMYYFTIDNVNVINCNNAPFTLVYSQFNNVKLLSCINNGGPVRILGCSTTTIDGLDIESSSTSSSVLDIIHSITTKAGVMVNNFHYEEGTGSTPAGDLIKIAQRGAGIRDMFATFTGDIERYIHLLDEDSEYYFDGNNIRTVPNSHVQLINLSNTGGKVSIKLGKGTTASTIESSMSIVSETEETDNNLTQNGIMRFFKVITSSMYKMLWFSDDETINFFDNKNRRVKQVNADMHIEDSHGRVVLRSGFEAGTSSVESNSTVLNIAKKDGSRGDHTEGLLRLSGHYLWVDASGILRMSSTLPTSDTDGTVIGSQN